MQMHATMYLNAPHQQPNIDTFFSPTLEIRLALVHTLP